MTLFSTLRDLFTAIAVGLGASAALSVALSLKRIFDGRRNSLLLQVSRSLPATEAAAATTEQEDSEVIHDVLTSAVADVAADQELPEAFVRGALFAHHPTTGSLRILKDQTVGFEDPDEALIEIRKGETGAGEAAESGQPVITVFESPQDESTIRDPRERKRINPALRWIISVPVLGTGSEALWVLNVDGLVKPRAAEQLRSSVARLLYYREVLEMLVNARGRSRQT